MSKAQVIETIQDLIDNSESFRLYGLRVTTPVLADKTAPHEEGFHAVQITAEDAWRFTFRTMSAKLRQNTPPPRPKRAPMSLHHGYYIIGASTGKILNEYGVPALVSHVYPVRLYASKIVRVNVTPEGEHQDRLETSMIVMEVSPEIANDREKALLIISILCALTHSDMFAVI